MSPFSVVMNSLHHCRLNSPERLIEWECGGRETKIDQPPKEGPRGKDHFGGKPESTNEGE